LSVAPPHRHAVPERCPVRFHERVRQHRLSRARAHRADAGRDRRDGAREARHGAAEGRREQGAVRPLGRHAQARRPRPVARPAARGGAVRRADHRPRSGDLGDHRQADPLDPDRAGRDLGGGDPRHPAGAHGGRPQMPPSPESSSSRSREVKVGLVILAALIVVAVGVFLIGDRNNLFTRKNHYYIELSSAQGLKPGNPVQLNGVDVGTIDKVILPQDPTHEHLTLWISVDRAYAERIRGPRQIGQVGENPPSKARIKTLGLLGDKYIEISFGSPEYPVIPPDGQIQAAEPTNVDALVASGEDVMDNVVEISHSLSLVLGRLERGQGFLGELLSDSESSRRLKVSLLGTADTLNRVANKLETGNGPVPRLLNDRKMADRLASSLERLDTVLAQAQNGPGLVPGLLNDAAMKTKVDTTLDNLNQVSRDLHTFTAGLDKNE